MDKQDERLLWLGDARVDETTFNRSFGRVLANLRDWDDFNPTRTAQHSGSDRAFFYVVGRGGKDVSLFTSFRADSASRLTPSEIVRRLKLELTVETRASS